MSVRRSISRVVLLIAILAGMLALGANSQLTPHRTADTWPNPLVVDSGPLPDPLIVDGATSGSDGATGGSDSVVEGV